VNNVTTAMQKVVLAGCWEQCGAMGKPALCRGDVTGCGTGTGCRGVPVSHGRVSVEPGVMQGATVSPLFWYYLKETVPSCIF